MKFCKYCGEVIDDNVVVCPKCGNNIGSSNEQSKIINSNNNTQNSSDPSIKNILTVFGILAGLAFAVGVVLLMIGGIQEYLFRTEYDLSNLTQEGVNLVRKYSKYPNSINFLTGGGICAGVGLLLDLIIILYRKINNK